MADGLTRGSLSDDDLETAIRDVAAALAWPAPVEVGGLDPARRARLRIVAETPRVRGGLVRGLALGGGRGRTGRAFVLAVAAILVVAAVAAAIGLGVPGIRLVPAPPASSSGVTSAGPGPSAGGPSTSPRPSGSASPAPSARDRLGSGLGLGAPLEVADAASAVDFPVRMPPAKAVGAPAAAWLLEGRLSLVWPSRPGLPPLPDSGLGLVLTEFRGSVEPGYFEKIISAETTVETVTVGRGTGYWISGAPHDIVFVDPSGEPTYDGRRSVGDTLLWVDGDLTFRLESALGKDGAIALAESLH